MLSFLDPSTAPRLTPIDDLLGASASAIDRRTRRQLSWAAPLALAALLVVTLGPLVPTFVSSLTRSSGTASATQAPVAGPAPAIDADTIASQVDHLLMADAAEPGVLTVTDARYAGRFDPSGFRLDPHTGQDGFAVSLQSITRGHDLPLSVGGWTADGNVAQRTVASGIAEQVTASEGSVEWDVVLDRAPAGAGDLVVQADVSGDPTGATATTRSWSVEGHTVSMGEMVVKDAGGEELYRALPALTTTGVALVVPDSVLAAADYPLLVDPVVSVPYPVTDGSTAREADIAFDGRNFLVVWQDTRGSDDPVSRDTTVYGARLTDVGIRLDRNGFRISDDVANGVFPPAVDFDGTNFFVVWTTYGADCPNGYECIRGARVDPGGSVLDPAGVLVAGAEAVDSVYAPDVAFDGTNHLVAYQVTGSRYDIDAVRVSPSGTAQTPFRVSTAVDFQELPAVASDGSGGSLVVWQDYRNGHDNLTPGDIYSSRVGPTGGALDPQGVLVSAGTNGRHDPAVAWNGERYLVVWTDDRNSDDDEWDLGDIYGARVTRDNVVQDAAGIPIGVAGLDAREPSVAANESTFLVVWSDSWQGFSRIRGTRVNDAGSSLDGELTIAGGQIHSVRPKVTNGPGPTWGTTYGIGQNSYDSVGLLSMRTIAPK